MLEMRLIYLFIFLGCKFVFLAQLYLADKWDLYGHAP